MRPDPRVAIVTGASRGIGAATARALAAAGCDVVLASRDEVALKRVAADVEAQGRRALVHPIDLQRIDGIPAMVERAVRDLGRLDILINNAGTNVRRPAGSSPRPTGTRWSTSTCAPPSSARSRPAG